MSSRLPALRTLRVWLPALAWMGIIFWLSSQPNLSPPSPRIDTSLLEVAGHLIEYGVLAALLFYAFYQHDYSYRGAIVLSFVTAFAYGLSDEWHQSFVPNRTPSWVDIAVDAIGAALALAIVMWWISRKRDDAA